MLHFKITFFLITLFTGIMSKLNDNSESGNEAVNEIELTNKEELEDNIPLHESYRSRHKYKLGTGHQDFNKRFVDINKGIKDSQCAIMYKDSEPVGILQPFEESYRFLPVQGESTYVEINPIPAKRRTVLDILYPTEFSDDYHEEKFSNTAKFSDDRYPSIFAKFKISSRLDKSSKESAKKKSNFKRALSFDNPDLDPIKSNINNEENVDIGRNIGIDENIGVEEHVGAEEHGGVEEKLKNILDDMGLIDDYPNQEVKDIKREVEDENLELGTNKINLMKEGKADTRKRREDKTDNPGIIDSNIASKEEASVEQNKQKFKRFENDMPVLDCTTVAFKGSHDVDDYEKRVEREIRQRIQKLKEEVKKEISNLTKSDDYTRRKKRQIFNTLIDEETKDINPTYNIEETEKALIRKKRTADFDNNKNNNRDKLQQKKREVDDINALDSFDDEPKTSELENHRFFQATRKLECSCDKNDVDCKCDESDPNKRLYKFQYNKDIGRKNQKRSKQVCSCDKNGNNCKCENALKETIPSMADSEYYDLGDDYNENGDLALRSVNSISALRDDNQYLTESEYENGDYTNNDKFEKRAVKPRKFAINKPMESGEYFVDFQPDTYNLSPRDTFRKKREKYDSNIFKNGQPHLVSFKQQDSMSPHSRYRRRILREENNLAPRQLIDMSDEDIFGALPQTFDGELLRYKRIRRSSRNGVQKHLQ